MEKKRLNKEKLFHNQWASKFEFDKLLVRESFEACTAPENRIIMEWLGDITGKKILDMGCGAGESSIYFCIKGADVTAIDISDGMINILKDNAIKYNVKIKTKVCTSHNTGFNNNSFDIVYAANLLHHVDLENTLREINRILKPGGILVSWDPLAHNPIINIYRRIAKEVRTEDEHPLKIEDLKIFRKIFEEVQYKTSWFFTLIIFIKFYLIEKVDPNKERYWKKIIYEHKRLEKMYIKLEKVDYYFLKSFPFLRRYCWNIIIKCQKKTYEK